MQEFCPESFLTSATTLIQKGCNVNISQLGNFREASDSSRTQNF